MNMLIEDTLGANREGTDKAARFLDDRIAEYETRLEKAEQALAEFQRANTGKLPGSEGGYFERMQRERDALEKTRRDLRLAQSKRARLQAQLTSEAPMLDDGSQVKEPRPDSIDARIRDQRAQLDKLLLKYTEEHPEVIAMRESLKRLEAQRAEQLRALGLANTDQQISALGANPVYQAVQIAMNEVDVEIATLEADARDRDQKLQDLQGLIDDVPGVEAELARLNRDYNVIKEQYQALIQSRERQQLSQQASASDQVEFRDSQSAGRRLQTCGAEAIAPLGGCDRPGPRRGRRHRRGARAAAAGVQQSENSQPGDGIPGDRLRHARASRPEGNAATVACAGFVLGGCRHVGARDRRARVV